MTTRTMILSVFLLAFGSTEALASKEVKYIPKKSSYDSLSVTKGGTYFDSLSNNPKVMNPILSSDANSTAIEGFVWARLFTEDSDNLNPLPYLATTYTISADKKSYTFTLNKDAKWDDGTPVTTADVKFTFDTQMDPKVDAAPLRAYWEGTTLEVVDPLTFKFTVTTPKFDTLRSLYLFQVIQKKQFDGEADFNKAKAVMNPMGNGPYKLKSFSRDQKIELERKKDWWGYSLPHFKHRFNADTIVLNIITDTNLNYEKFVKGDMDVFTFEGPGLEIYKNRVLGVDKDKFGKSAADGKSIWTTEVKNKAPRGYSYVGWNLKKPLFQSKKTRQALAHLANYEQISEKVFYGFSYQSTSPFGSLTMNADPELRKPGKMMAFDPKKALALLKEDGWADTDGDNIIDKVINGKKTPFKFELKYNSNNPARGKVAQILKENFKSAGIEISIRAMEWNAYLGDVDARNFEALILAWTATPYPNPRQTWHTEAEKNQGSNFVSYSNPQVDALIEKANLEFDLTKRAKILHEINRIIYDDQPYMFLLEPRSMIAGFQKKVKSKIWAQAYDVGPPTDIYSFAP